MRRSKRAKYAGKYKSRQPSKPYENVYKSTKNAYFINANRKRKRKRYLNAKARKNMI